MPTTPRPIVKATAVPDKKYDGQGKITNWSQLWPEAKELDTLVVHGLVDDMTHLNFAKNALHSKHSPTDHFVRRC
jgi:hypothetical protein